MSKTTVYIQRKDDPQATALLTRLRSQGHTRLKNVTIERVFRLEGEIKPEDLLSLLKNPVYEQSSFSSALNPDEGPIIEIGYQRAVTDPETPSILDGAKALGIKGLEWARLSLRYQFTGLGRREAKEIATGLGSTLFNPVVQVVIKPRDKWGSLKPHGIPSSLEFISLKNLSDEELVKLSTEHSWYAPLSQMKALQVYEIKIGRPLTDAEIEIIVQSWSDHCYHTTWKGLGLLERLMAATEEINHPLIVSVFTDNAGGIRFYDSWVIIIKGETHNFPSAVATFGGIATKHGGIIRDAIGFGKGGYPIGGSTIMGTMDPRIPNANVPRGALHPRVIVQESIRGTAYYLNPMGIPMMHPIYRIHPGYPKCFALGHTIGIIPEKYALKDKPRANDIVLLIGGKTGRDGIHGATASSAGMTGETIQKDSAAVQIGHPIVERKFMTAIPELRDANCIRSFTDLGAGGISCAAGEIGKETGIFIDLAKIPLKDESLADWEILLSESQERMFAAIPPEKLELALKILKRHNVEATIIGRFTDTRRLVAVHNGVVAADIEMNFLWAGCPIEQIETKKPRRNLLAPKTSTPKTAKQWEEEIEKILSHYHCCDQSPAGFQFDSTVQGRTVVGPYGGKTGKMPTNIFLSAPLRGKPYGVMTTVSYFPFYGEIDPEGLARLTMVDAATKAIAAGVRPKDIVDIVLCDNFYTPRITPEIAWDLKTMVETISDSSVAFKTPFVSGKDSSSGTFTSKDGKKINVPLTLVVSTLCRMEDVRQVVTKDFKEDGNFLVLVGRYDPQRLGGSVYLDCHNERGNKLPDFGKNWEKELLATWSRLHDIYQQNPNPVKAASAIGEGGLLLRLFEMCYGGKLGALVNLSQIHSGRLDGILFGEMIGSILLEVSKDYNLEETFKGLPWQVIGTTIKSPELIIRGNEKLLCNMSIDELEEAWETTFKEIVQ